LVDRTVPPDVWKDLTIALRVSSSAYASCHAVSRAVRRARPPQARNENREQNGFRNIRHRNEHTQRAEPRLERSSPAYTLGWKSGNTNTSAGHDTLRDDGNTTLLGCPCCRHRDRTPAARLHRVD